MPDLNPREKILLSAASLLLVAALLWMAVLRPSLDLRAAALAQIIRADAVASLLDQVPEGRAVGSVSERPPLRQRVADTARRSGVGIRRLDPQGATLSVSLDDVAFATLIGWLDTLTGPQRVRILSAEFGRRPEPGVVSAQLLLEDLR